MPRWVIINLSDNSIASEYVSDRKELGTNRFGGAWDDPARSLHLQVPAELESAKLHELECTFEPNGQRVDDCGCLLWVQEPMLNVHGKQVTLKAYDGGGQPIWDAQGNQAELPAYSKLPVLGPVRKLRRKG